MARETSTKTLHDLSFWKWSKSSRWSEDKGTSQFPTPLMFVNRWDVAVSTFKNMCASRESVHNGGNR